MKIPRSGFCSLKHYYAFRDRRRYAENREAQLERARRYYREHREKILGKAAAKRGKPRPPERTTCEECGALLEGRQRVSCGKAACRDRRFNRTNPAAYARREAAKVERRRDARRAKREVGDA